MWWTRQTQEAPLTPHERRDQAISAFIDDELTDAERLEIEALLAQDADARGTLHDFQMLSSALGALGEVRAPRSFAIPAPQAAPVRSGLYRRLEMGMRASAAVAALFFVVAIVQPPGSASDDMDSFEATTSLAAPEAARNSGEADAAGGGMGGSVEGVTAAAEAEGTAASTAASTEATPAAGIEPGSAPSSDGAPAPDTANPAFTAPDAPPVDGATKGPESAQDTAAFNPPLLGTDEGFRASDGVGGVAPALGTLAVLLTALSVLTARTRGAGNAGHR